MRTRRSSDSNKPLSDFKDVLENLHAPIKEAFKETRNAVKHSTLAEASKQDLDKLLDRASVRGAAANERSKRAGDFLNSRKGKRAKQQVALEEEASLFFQRKGTSSMRNDGTQASSGDTLICGAIASTLEDIKDGGSGGQSSSLASAHLPTTDMSELVMDSQRSLETQQRHSQNVSMKDSTVFQGDSLMDDADWEVGYRNDGANIGEDIGNRPWTGEISLEVDRTTPQTSERQGAKRHVRRATAKDKEFAELVHKAHLLCLIARGRIVDCACDDPLLQASILSILPPHINIPKTEHIRPSDLGPLVKWFQRTFQISKERDFQIHSNFMDANHDFALCLLSALQQQAGSSEEVAALSVSLLRALGLTVRYVKVLDVTSLKPDASSLEASSGWDPSGNSAGARNAEAFSQQILSRIHATSLGRSLAECERRSPMAGAEHLQDGSSPLSKRSPNRRRKDRMTCEQKQKETVRENGGPSLQSSGYLDGNEVLNMRKAQVGMNLQSSGKQDSIRKQEGCADLETMNQTKRKGDLEFELQLAMALAATSTSMNSGPEMSGVEELLNNHQHQEDACSSKQAKSLKGRSNGVAQSLENAKRKSKSSNFATTGAVWSRKMGPLLHWAEVYCGEGDAGRWVHLDAGRGILDGANIVEGAAASCKIPLCYVLAFAGNGAKDVTRRYTTLWSAVVPLRVNNDWWTATLAPLKQLEAAATSGFSEKSRVLNCAASASPGPALETPNACKKDVVGTSTKVTAASTPSEALSSQNKLSYDRSSLEDMELDVRAYTEPLPKNQQAYKNHHLYALEKWLTKYQTLYPRGPILGYCAGQPVYPRTCVQNLHTAERWLREGFKVREGEAPAKMVKNSRLMNKEERHEHSAMLDESSDAAAVTVLFGKWQTEPWQPPAAVGGVVPKNERGNVELWSEKCLPLGTVHISLPQILPIAKKLDIDFAPAMVGFEIRNRKSVPVFEGIVVCKEYESVLLEAYAEEEHRRSAEAGKKKEIQAAARWWQLLRAVMVRQRLQATYQDPETASAYISPAMLLKPVDKQPLDSEDNHDARTETSKHEHTFPEQHQSYDEETGIRTKVCSCGFILTVEEL